MGAEQSREKDIEMTCSSFTETANFDFRYDYTDKNEDQRWQSKNEESRKSKTDPHRCSWLGKVQQNIKRPQKDLCEKYIFQYTI